MTIKTGNIYTGGNAGGLINITSHHDGIDTTGGVLNAFGAFGSVGNVSINASGSISAGNIATNYTYSNPWNLGMIDTRTGEPIKNPKGGSINIQGEKFFLNGRTVSAYTSGKGSGGAISINTSDGITITNNGQIRTEVQEKAQGNGGEINLITNGSLLLENGAKIINSTSGKGDGGKVSINALEGITLINNSQISTAVTSGANGNSGEITIKTLGQFLLQDNSEKAPVNAIKNSPTPQIIEAQGWVKTSDGNIALVAQAPSITPKSTSSLANCPVVQ